MMTLLSVCNVGVEKLKTRSSTDIIGLILQAAEGEPLTRSKIMYPAKLNFLHGTDYAVFLTDVDLLTYLKECRQHGITDKGRRFLRLFKEVNKLLKVANNNNNRNNYHHHLVANNQKITAEGAIT